MKAIVIHYRHSRARHIKPRALRSAIQLFVTCKVCQRKHWPSIVQVITGLAMPRTDSNDE